MATNPYTSRTAPAMMPADWAEQQSEIDYRTRLADQLAGDTQMPSGQVVGGIYVRPSITQMLAKALNPVIARQNRAEAGRLSADLAEKQATERSGAMERFAQKLAGTPESAQGQFYPAGGNPDEESGMGYRPAVAGNREAALGELARSRDPMLQQLAMAQMLKGIEPPKREAFTLGPGQVRYDETGKQVANVAPKTEKPFIRTRVMGDQEVQEQLQADGSYQEIGRGPRFARQIAPVINLAEQSRKAPKLPTSALKMQQEELDAIGTVGAINADLAAIDKQIEGGKLNLGVVGNLAAKAKNFVGASDESSRNLASFQATLEKLRNDSLRLNKGVQTEGDAQRAWNELVANINDPKVVRQRMAEIQKINDRAAGLRRMNVDVIRSNFGVEPMDTAPRMNQPAAVGGGGSNVDDLLKKYGG